MKKLQNIGTVVSNDQSKVAQDQQNVNDDRTQVNSDKQAQQTAQQNANSANSKVQSAQSSLNDAKSKQQSIQNDLNNVNSQINQATHGISITPQDGYNAQMVQDYQNGQVPLSTVASAASATENTATNFVPSSNDDEMVDPANLTQSQQEELTKFVASILNPLRADSGSVALTPNSSAIKFADDVVAGYNKDNWNISNGHDDTVIENAAHENGLNDGGNYYEDAVSGISTNEESMNELEKQVYDGIKLLLFKDCAYSEDGSLASDPNHMDWAHARDLLGSVAPGYHEPTKVYLGVSIDKLG